MIISYLIKSLLFESEVTIYPYLSYTTKYMSKEPPLLTSLIFLSVLLVLESIILRSSGALVILVSF